MSDALLIQSRLAQADSLYRKSVDRADKASDVSAAPASQGAAVPIRVPLAQDGGANVVGSEELKARIKQEPEFDRAKVDAIRDAIKNGQYPLDSRRIAESFVAIEQLISD
jgi:negative regulator of flagellin synthesis FlgM